MNRLFLIVLLLSSVAASSQDRIILSADQNVYFPSKNAARVFQGNVRITHKGVILYCDTAYYYDSVNLAKGYGHIQINQHDTLNIYGDTVFYEGGPRIATIYGKVKLIDDNAILRSPSLTYKLDSNIAYYDKGGFMTDQTTGDTLISNTGTYFGNRKMIVFEGDVYYRSTEYVIRSEKMTYNTEESKVYFDGPTTIVSDENTIYCESGWYDTRNDVSSFSGKGQIVSESRTITGDSIYYDRVNGKGEIYGHMLMVDTAENISVSGGFGKYDEKSGEYEVTLEPIFRQFNEKDTLFLIADTLFARNDTLNNNSRIKAFRNVRFMQGTLSGKCDSLIYSESDSILNMYYDPVIWQDSSQLSGDTIYVRTFDGKMQNLKLRTKAFIVSMDDSTKFNQISGRNMLGLFEENSLKTIYVNGNGHTVYYARNDEDKLVGMDNSVCSDIRIQMEEDQIKKIVFLKEPESVMYPIHEIPADKKILPNFKNRFHEVDAVRNDILKRIQ